MFLEKRKTANRRKVHAYNKKLPYHAEKIDDLFSFYLVGVLCGPNTVKSYKLHRSGHLKEHKFKVQEQEDIVEATTEEWRAPGIIMRINPDTKYKLGSFLYMVADNTNSIEKITGKRARIGEK